MRKYTLILLALGVLTVGAAKPVAQLVQSIWYLVNGTITADGGSGPLLQLNNPSGRQFLIGQNGGVALGTDFVDSWYNTDLQRMFVSLIDLDNESLSLAGFHAESVSEANSRYNVAELYTTPFGGIFQFGEASNAVFGIADATQAFLGVFSVTGYPSLMSLDGFSNGSGPAWKLGSVIPATVQLVTDRYVQVEIGGQIVKLAVVE